MAQAGKPPVDIVNMPLMRAVQLIRGPKGTTVTLTLVPAGLAGAATKTASLVRDEITLEDQQAKARIVDLPVGKGAPKGTRRARPTRPPCASASSSCRRSMPTWAAATGAARPPTSRACSEKLQAEHVRGVVLDLRQNGGGSLEEAISLTGLFIRKGPVVQTRGADGKVVVDEDTDPAVLYDGPLVLLTSRFSASASEILAGALQDYGRAVVVGDSSTFGKGTVQNIVPLAGYMDQIGLGHAYDPGALKITTSKFYRPSGASTQLRGVKADLVLPSASDLSEVSEASLKDPLPWDVVPAAPYERLNRVEPYVGGLREKSERRRATDKPFAEHGERHRQAEKRRGLEVGVAERGPAPARDGRVQGSRDRAGQARSARSRATGLTTYEITLKNASAPGLPSPVAAPNGAPANDKDRDSEAKIRSATDDIILNEGVRILADYVNVLNPPADKSARTRRTEAASVSRY